MRRLLVLSTLVLGLAHPAYSDPAGRALVENHVLAAGGEAAFASLVSVHRCGTISFEDAGSGPSGAFRYETALQVPDLLVERLARPGEMLVHRGYDRGRVWDQTAPSDDPSLAAQATGMQDTIAGANRDGIGLLALAAEAEIVPRPERVPAENSCIRIPSVPDIPIHCYSHATGLLSYLVRGDTMREFSDWRAVGEVMLPFRLTQSEAGQIVYEIALETAETNLAGIGAMAVAMRGAADPSERSACTLPGPQ